MKTQLTPHGKLVRHNWGTSVVNNSIISAVYCTCEYALVHDTIHAGNTETIHVNVRENARDCVVWNAQVVTC